jgi:hypothetical protein
MVMFRSFVDGDGACDGRCLALGSLCMDLMLATSIEEYIRTPERKASNLEILHPTNIHYSLLSSR